MRLVVFADCTYPKLWQRHARTLTFHCKAYGAKYSNFTWNLHHLDHRLAVSSHCSPLLQNPNPHPKLSTPSPRSRSVTFCSKRNHHDFYHKCYGTPMLWNLHYLVSQVIRPITSLLLKYPRCNKYYVQPAASMIFTRFTKQKTAFLSYATWTKCTGWSSTECHTFTRTATGGPITQQNFTGMVLPIHATAQAITRKGGYPGKTGGGELEA